MKNPNPTGGPVVLCDRVTDLSPEHILPGTEEPCATCGHICAIAASTKKGIVDKGIPWESVMLQCSHCMECPPAMLQEAIRNLTREQLDEIAAHREKKFKETIH